MGQQQLLLVILVTIIVGIATVVAINTFGSAADSANVDAVRNDVAQIASSAQAEYQKPAALGGAGQKWSNVTFEGMAFPGVITDANNTTAVNQNGTYVITGSTSGLKIEAYPSSDPGYTGNPESSKGGTVTDASAGTSGGNFVFTVTKDQIDLTTDYTPGGAAAGG